MFLNKETKSPVHRLIKATTRTLSARNSTSNMRVRIHNTDRLGASHNITDGSHHGDHGEYEPAEYHDGGDEKHGDASSQTSFPYCSVYGTHVT